VTTAADEPGTGPDRAGEVPERRCVRCGAVGTHYLTCPDLRLPSDFRFGEASRNTSGRRDAMRDTWT
jgi:hypothetical protein